MSEAVFVSAGKGKRKEKEKKEGVYLVCADQFSSFKRLNAELNKVKYMK
jgi:hypothetical protein